MAKVLQYSTYGILFLWLQIGTRISLYLKGNCMYLCWIERATYTLVSLVTEGNRYLTSETKETQRCGLLRLACIWDMWVLGLGTLQRDDSNYCYFLCCNIYVYTLWSTQWMMGEWIVGMFFYHGIPYYEMLFAPSMLGTCVRLWKSIIVCTEQIGINTSFFVCIFNFLLVKENSSTRNNHPNN
jgi:hypothetical protein